MGSVDVLYDQADGVLKATITEFMAFKNILAILYGDEDLGTILSEYGHLVVDYGKTLLDWSSANADLAQRIHGQNQDAITLAGREPKVGVRYASILFGELAGESAWETLRTLAERHLADVDPGKASDAKRYLALSMGNSEINADKYSAIRHYQELILSEYAHGTDYGNLAKLLWEAGRIKDAGTAVLEGIAKFPEQAPYFADMGHQLVSATGDRELRQRIEDAITGAK